MSSTPTKTRRAATAYDLDGLRAAVNDSYSPPPQITVSAFKKLDKNSREEWLLNRTAHHGRSFVVLTDAMGQAFTDIHLLSELNRFRPDDREVYMINGPAGLGKTTIARQVAVNFERKHRERHPDYLRNDECPVVMVATPAKCSPTAFDKALLTFLHYSYPDVYTHERLKSRVVHALRDKRVQLVIIDDLHRLRSTGKLTLETADLLKEYFDLSTCTFIYLGINLTTSGFFEGDAGQQILNRGSLLTLQQCSNEKGDRQREWRAIVGGLESNLRLLRHRPGSLTNARMLQELYDRTLGRLGALNKLLQTAAMYAATIEDPETEDLREFGIVGRERIDLGILRAVKSVASITTFEVGKKADNQ